MDNFMSKLSQKINAQESIKANFMADMAEKEQMKKQLQEYEAVLQSVRDLYLKQDENSELFTRIAEKLEVLEQAGADASLLEELKLCISKSDEFTHKECVKVYRNVQALLEEQDKRAEEGFGAVRAEIEKCKTEDMREELAFLRTTAERAEKRAKYGMGMLALALLISVVNLAVIFMIFGIF